MSGPLLHLCVCLYDVPATEEHTPPLGSLLCLHSGAYRRKKKHSCGKENPSLMKTDRKCSGALGMKEKEMEICNKKVVLAGLWCQSWTAPWCTFTAPKIISQLSQEMNDSVPAALYSSKHNDVGPLWFSGSLLRWAISAYEPTVGMTYYQSFLKQYWLYIIDYHRLCLQGGYKWILWFV